jgi:uncharacterized protein YaaQ
MKLVVAVILDYDVDRLLRAVTEASLGATRVASTGGYLRTGNTTVLLGVPDDRVAQCLRLLATVCGARLERAAAGVAADLPEIYASGLADVTVGGGVAFVAPVQRFERFAR